MPIRRWESHFGKVTAVKFHNANFDELEAICRADVEFRGGQAVIPNRRGPVLFVEPGQYLVQDEANGRLSVMSNDEFMPMYRLLGDA